MLPVELKERLEAEIAMNMLIAGLVSSSAGPVAAQAQSATAGPGAAGERKYFLEQVDDAAGVQLYADGFESLPLDQKTLIWHLYQAAVAGRDIFYDQRYEHNLAMRDILEEIWTHAEGIDPATLAEVQRYTKLFWLNTGPYNNLSARKFVLKCTPDAFLAAAKVAERNGARFPLGRGETLEAMLKRYEPMFFDATFDPMVTAPDRTHSFRVELLWYPSGTSGAVRCSHPAASTAIARNAAARRIVLSRMPSTSRCSRHPGGIDCLRISFLHYRDKAMFYIML